MAFIAIASLSLAPGCTSESTGETATVTTLDPALAEYLVAVDKAAREQDQLHEYLQAVDQAKQDALNVYLQRVETAERERQQAAALRQFFDAVEAAPPPPSSSSTCPGGTYVNTYGNTVCSPYRAPSAPSGASAQCSDGTYSFSQSRQGTCSHHGGVASWL